MFTLLEGMDHGYKEDISHLESYLEQGGNIIVGSADSYTVASSHLRKPMRSFVTKLGLFDRGATTKVKAVETSMMPVQMMYS